MVSKLIKFGLAGVALLIIIKSLGMSWTDDDVIVLIFMLMGYIDWQAERVLKELK